MTPARAGDRPAPSRADLRTTASGWLAVDPDPETRATVQELLDAGDDDALADLFTGRLDFGTAGLRAEMGPGPIRMNRVVVRAATAGLLEVLPDRPTVVIGFDARRRSRTFADDVAAVVVHAGGRALVFDRLVPTPVVADAVRRLEADAGVMCTASHNPPGDNGYKVFGADGAQVVAPVDEVIATAIERRWSDVGRLVGADGVDAEAGPGRIERLGDDVIGDYVDDVLRLAGAPAPHALGALSVVYTPLHGVGGELFDRVMRRAGVGALRVVEEQAAPDPDFPTAPYPNPEEDGATDLAVALARHTDADVVLANDPDADRLAVVVPDRRGPGWTALTGDQIGALLADHLLRHTTGADRLVASSFVSSRLLAAMAAHHGVTHVETLTGVRWIARAALDHPDRRFVFGYEESLGYLIGDQVRDKDGIAGGLVFAALVADLHASGQTVWDRWSQLSARFGWHESLSTSVRFPTRAVADEVSATLLAELRTRPPDCLGGRPLQRVVDYAVATPARPGVDAVGLELDGLRVVVRPSGTEPKIKCYGEVVVAPGVAGIGDHPRSAARVVLHDAEAELATLVSRCSRPAALARGVG